MSEDQSVTCLADQERSAFGLGYEHARRGNLADDNCQFQPGTNRFEWYCNGYRAFFENLTKRRLFDTQAV